MARTFGAEVSADLASAIPSSVLRRCGNVVIDIDRELVWRVLEGEARMQIYPELRVKKFLFALACAPSQGKTHPVWTSRQGVTHPVWTSRQGVTHPVWTSRQGVTHALSKSDLLASLEPPEIGEHALSQAASQVRDLLGDLDRKVLRAIRNVGYELDTFPYTEPQYAQKQLAIEAALENARDGTDALDADRSGGRAEAPMQPAIAFTRRRDDQSSAVVQGGYLRVLAAAAFAIALASLWAWQRIPPQTPIEVIDLVRVRAAVESAQPERIWDVLPTLEKALVQQPNSAELLALYADAWSIDYEIGSSKINVVLDLSLPAARKAVAIAPEYAGASSALGMALLNLDRFNLALSSYQQAVALEPNRSKYWSRLAVNQSLLLQPIAAEASYLRAGALSQDDWTALGLVFNRAMQGAVQTAQFESLRQRFPQNLYVPYEFAWTEHWAGRTEAARAVMERFYQIDPTRSWAIAQLAELRRLDGDAAGAKSLMSTHKALYTKYDGDNSILVMRLLRRYAPNEAQVLAQQFQTVSGPIRELAYSQWLTGEIALARGNREDALRAFEAAWQLDLDNGVFLRNWRIDLGITELLTHEAVLRAMNKHARADAVRAVNKSRAALARANGFRTRLMDVWNE